MEDLKEGEVLINKKIVEWLEIVGNIKSKTFFSHEEENL